MAGTFILAGADEVRRDLAAVRQMLADPRQILELVGEMGVASIQRNFEAGGRPQKWKPLSSSTLEQQYKNRKTGALKPRHKKTGGHTAGYTRFVGGKKALIDTGHLYESFTWRVEGTNVLIGTSVSYAAAHQFGVGPHTIRPKTKKALAWPGGAHPVKSVNHPGIQARPFMIIPADDWSEIVATVQKLIPLGGGQQ